MRKVKNIAAAGMFLAGIAVSVGARAALSPMVLTITETQGPNIGQSDTYYGNTAGTLVVDSAAFPSPSNADFVTNLELGSSDLSNGTNEASLQVDYVNIASTVAGPLTLKISLTDSGFTFPGAVGSQLQLSSSAGATLVNYTTGDTLTFQSTASDSGGSVSTPLQTLVVPSSATATTLDLSAPDVSSLFTRTDASYTLSSVATLNFSQPFEQENFNGTTATTLAPSSPIPEPSSAALLIPVAVLLTTRSRRNPAAS
jgi:hypothetical protein